MNPPSLTQTCSIHGEVEFIVLDSVLLRKVCSKCNQTEKQDQENKWRALNSAAII